jgi:uncharacterized FlaG/YvyC family protein
MKEYSLSSISNKEPDYSAGAVSRAAQNQPPASVSSESSRASKGKPAAHTNSEPSAQADNTFLRFKVDENTNDVTVYVLDRNSRQVVRTIPSDQINKLQAGDLLDLLS